MRKLRWDDDVPGLFALFSKIPGDVLLPRYRKSNSIAEFSSWLSLSLRGFFHDFLVEEVEQSGRNKIIGFGFSYDFRSCDRHCKILCYRSDGGESGILREMVEWLQRLYPLRKIMMHIPNGCHLIQEALKSGFWEEARLPERVFADGKYRDLSIMSRLLCDDV